MTPHQFISNKMEIEVILLKKKGNKQTTDTITHAVVLTCLAWKVSQIWGKYKKKYHLFG